MATTKITFDNKVAVIPPGNRVNQVWDEDINEIKDVVNKNADVQINQSETINNIILNIDNVENVSNFPKIQFTADGTQNTFDLITNVLAKAVFWNGAILDDSDWSQTSNILTLTFTPDLGAIIKPI